MEFPLQYSMRRDSRAAYERREQLFTLLSIHRPLFWCQDVSSEPSIMDINERFYLFSCKAVDHSHEVTEDI